MKLFEDYLKLKEQIAELEEEKLSYERLLYSTHKGEIDRSEKDTCTFYEGDYILKIVKRTNYKVIQEAAEQIGGLSFRKKWELDKKYYDSLGETEKKIVDACLISSPGKPSFQISKMESV